MDRRHFTEEHARYLARSTGLARKVLKHHHPRRDGQSLVCHGCDLGGNAEFAAEFPCSTYVLVVRDMNGED